jgi:hypothetical protein
MNERDVTEPILKKGYKQNNPVISYRRPILKHF